MNQVPNVFISNEGQTNDKNSQYLLLSHINAVFSLDKRLAEHIKNYVEHVKLF